MTHRRTQALFACLAAFWLLLSLLMPGGVFAQPVPATETPRVVFPLTPVGNVTTVGPRTADAANARRFSFGVAANGAVFANTGTTMPTPGGGSIPIGVNGQVSKANVGAALGRFARKVYAPLVVGSALYDLGQELGFFLDNSGGSLVVTQAPDPDLFCTVSPCYTWSVSVPYYMTAGTPEAVCRAAIAAVSSPGDVANYVSNTFTECRGVRPATNFQIVIPITNRGSRPPDQVANTPSSLEAFESAVAARSGWPTSSALARTLVDAINSGESPLVEPVTVTGPASSPGSVTQTVNTSAGTTTTATQTHNYTYSGPNVTVNTTTTSVTVDNSTGAVLDQSTTTITPEVPTPPEPSPAVCGGPGLSACNVKVDETGTPQYDPDPFTLPESLQQQTEQQLEQIADAADKAGLFSDFASLFTLPPLRECAPVVLPSLLGRELGSLNPCAGVDWLRGLMAWVWAVAGFLFCWGCVRESI